MWAKPIVLKVSSRSSGSCRRAPSRMPFSRAAEPPRMVRSMDRSMLFRSGSMIPVCQVNERLRRVTR